MILTAVKKVEHRDLAKYAWSRLALFQNAEHTTEQIVRRHKVGANHLPNARNQSEQIRYCLSQGREYWSAAETVTLATRPVLLYYAAMSLALAEILIKQTGDSRLSKLRQHHASHGLTLKVAKNPELDEGIAQAAGKLVAKVQTNVRGEPAGTFEVWRRSSREYPIGGMLFDHTPFGSTQRFALLLEAGDDTAPVFPNGGLSLIDCLRELPQLADMLSSLGDGVRLVRAKVEANRGTDFPTSLLSIVVHPNTDELIDAFGNACRISPNTVNYVEFNEFPSGFGANFHAEDNSYKLSLPPATSIDHKQIFFSCAKGGLNEFGYLYVALHICGNFARYYPDVWLKHIERSTPLCIAIDEMCKVAFERLPLLSLSEMSGVYQIASG